MAMTTMRAARVVTMNEEKGDVGAVRMSPNEDVNYLRDMELVQTALYERKYVTRVLVLISLRARKKYQDARVKPLA